MQLITILTVLLPVASATPVFPVIRPFVPHGLARAVPVFTQSDLPTDTVISGPVPTKWRHTHGPLLSGSPFYIAPVYKSDEPEDATGAKRRLPRATNIDSNVTATANTNGIVPIAPKLKVLIPPPPMTNVEVCQALCSMYGSEPCGPCEDISNSPDAIIPPLNAERTNIVSARALTTQQDRAWLPSGDA